MRTRRSHRSATLENIRVQIALPLMGRLPGRILFFEIFFDFWVRTSTNQGILQLNVVAQNPAAYRPNLSATLNSLGALYGESHRFAEAEEAFKEAADMQRALAAQNPVVYRPGHCQGK